MTLTLDFPEAQRLTMHYVCSSCWGRLILKFADDRMYTVECGKCGEDTRGYVTKSYVDQRRNESACEKSEAVSVLRELGILEKPDTTPEQLLDELGY